MCRSAQNVSSPPRALQEKVTHDTATPPGHETATNEEDAVDFDAIEDSHKDEPTTEAGFMYLILRQSSADRAGPLLHTDDTGTVEDALRPGSSAALSSRRSSVTSSSAHDAWGSGLEVDALTTSTRTPHVSIRRSTNSGAGYAAERALGRRKRDPTERLISALERCVVVVLFFCA